MFQTNTYNISNKYIKKKTSYFQEMDIFVNKVKKKTNYQCIYCKDFFKEKSYIHECIHI